MATRRRRANHAGGEVTIQLSVVELVLVCLALAAATGLLAYGFVTVRSHESNSGRPAALGILTTLDGTNADVPPVTVPPWGELFTRDIELEQPEEYAAYAIDTHQAPIWAFPGMTAERVRAVLQSCGLTPGQVDRALSPALASITLSNTVIKPDDELVLSLSPQTRATLYRELARDPTNGDLRFPLCYPKRSVTAWFKDLEPNDTGAAVLKKLLYPRGDNLCFSDYGVLWRQVSSEAERLDLVKVLSRQPAVLVRLRVRPDTNIDKVLAYWSRGLKVRDVRPLLDALKQLPEGGSINLLQLLPLFARQRLYTFPLPPKPGDTTMDCHWSTMNYFNETPDNRFGNPVYTSAYANTNFFQVDRATHYGDVLFFFDGLNSVVHSAVYLADDIVFTKNGNNFAQPWKLMRLKDLVDRFTANEPPRVVVYREKSS